MKTVSIKLSDDDYNALVLLAKRDLRSIAMMSKKIFLPALNYTLKGYSVMLYDKNGEAVDDDDNPFNSNWSSMQENS